MVCSLASGQRFTALGILCQRNFFLTLQVILHPALGIEPVGSGVIAGHNGLEHRGDAIVRGRKGRAYTTACDHDFHPEATCTSVGIVVPIVDAVFLYEVLSKVISDCRTDCGTQW